MCKLRRLFVPAQLSRLSLKQFFKITPQIQAKISTKFYKSTSRSKPMCRRKNARKPETVQPLVSLGTKQTVKVGSHTSNQKSQGPNHKTEVMRITQPGSSSYTGNGSQAKVPPYRTQRAAAETTEVLCFLPFKMAAEDNQCSVSLWHGLIRGKHGLTEFVQQDLRTFCLPGGHCHGA